MKYFIKTFGCQMNEADSEKIAGWYEQKGWQRAENIKAADEVVINTCSVRQSAENRVFGLVNNLGKLPAKGGSASGRKIILTGCMLRYPLRRLREKFSQVNEFKKIESYKVAKLQSCKGLIPIMEGCSHYCTYCVVPYARGKEKSRPFKEIVCEAEELVRRGYEKITLLGQNVNSYKPSFAKLLRTLEQISGLKKISFLTSNPWDLTTEIIEAMSLPKIDRYLHLPVQSGDNEILKRMNRPYTAKQYFVLVEKIRKKNPGIKIGTDIIVGFPGETEKQFRNTVLLCRKIGFEKAYIAKYSPRPGTAAFKLKDNVPPEEKKRRWQVLDDLINKH